MVSNRKMEFKNNNNSLLWINHGLKPPPDYENAKIWLYSNDNNLTRPRSSEKKFCVSNR